MQSEKNPEAEFLSDIDIVINQKRTKKLVQGRSIVQKCDNNRSVVQLTIGHKSE